MILTVPLVMALAVGSAICLDPSPAAVDLDPINRRAIYLGGVSFEQFLTDVESRHDMWHGNYERARVPADVLDRARAVGGTWYLLVVAVDTCGDSANTIPYLARLVEQVDGLEMRIVHPDAGREVMEAHLTPDGRAATPTIAVLNDRYDEVGCFIERPTNLQTWWLENETRIARDELLRQKYVKYDEDGGASTMRQIVESMEAATRGDTVCR